MVMLIGLGSSAQDDTTMTRQGSITVRKKPKEVDYWPHIAGNYSGEIEPAFLCSENGVRNNVKWQILSFTFIAESGAGSVKREITGNVIPRDLCKLISKMSNGTVIYIQDIQALDHQNRKVKLNSLRYQIIGSTANKGVQIEERYPEPDDD